MRPRQEIANDRQGIVVRVGGSKDRGVILPALTMTSRALQKIEKSVGKEETADRECSNAPTEGTVERMPLTIIGPPEARSRYVPEWAK